MHARAVLAARLPACTPTPRPTRPDSDKERGNGRGILCTLDHGAGCTTFIRHHYRVYRSYTRPRRCRRPAARPFIQDDQSAVRLSVSPSRRSRDGLTGSRTAPWTSRTNRLAAGRRTASGSRITAINTIVISYESSASGAVI